jgi:hypothetical protein
VGRVGVVRSKLNDSAYLCKLLAFERYLGLDKLTDAELSRLAAPEFPDGVLAADRHESLVAILRHHLFWG